MRSSCFRSKRSQSLSQKSTPFPWRQLIVLGLCRLCEPVAFMSVFPYIYFMIQSFGYTDVKYISLAASGVTSAFAFAEFGAAMFWGRLSDRIGRKPVLLTGMFGTGLSMLAFGFARNLPVALTARIMGGLLNGNIGVLQTTVAEVVTVESHKPRAYSIMPFVWCIGSIIGSSLGGLLSQPVRNYPQFFTAGSIWDQFPFLLPNLVCVSFVFFGLIVGLLFLEETHEDCKDRPDRGLQLGQALLRLYSKAKSEDASLLSDKSQAPEEAAAFLPPRSELRRNVSSETLDIEKLDKKLAAASMRAEQKKIPIRSAFTPQILLLIFAIGILAFHTISLEQQLPILMAYEQPPDSLASVFRFLAGFGMDAKTIGSILAVQGFLQMLAQTILFPMVNRRLGSLWTFRLVIFSYPILYTLTPYLALVPHQLRMPGLYMIIVWKVTAQSMSYPCLMMMIASLAPSKKVLGTVNGVAMSSASLCRAVGPMISAVVHAFGTSLGCSGLVWWSMALVAVVGAIECIWMKGEPTRKGLSEKDEEAAEQLLDSDILPAPIDDQFTNMPLIDSDSDETAAEESETEDEGTLCNTPRTPSLDWDLKLKEMSVTVLPKDGL